MGGISNCKHIEYWLLGHMLGFVFKKESLEVFMVFAEHEMRMCAWL